MDGLLQPRIGSLFQGVSRQAPLTRAPNQFEDLVNSLPSVDLGGSQDRAGTVLVESLPRANYSTGPHHFFRTTDGQRWVLLRVPGSASFEVRNWVTGAVAPVTVSPAAWNYLTIGGGNLKFLTIADTTLILNPAYTVEATESAVPALTTAYLVIRRTSSAQQQYVISGLGIGTAFVSLPYENRETRESVASALNQHIAITSGPSLQVTSQVLGKAPYVIKLTGSAAAIDALTARNSWDEGAVTLIKGRVSAEGDLPPAFEDGVSIAVDLGRGDKHSISYVRYDSKINAWIETSYLPNDATTATLNAATMPMRLRQETPTTFSLDVCPWNLRNKGDHDSNPLPFFVGKKITALATWKGRLAFLSQDTLVLSQANDLFNWWRETAREVRASDPIELPADTPGLSELRHVVPFRNKLIVTADNAQLEVPGDEVLTPEKATIGVATRYNLDPNCTPVVVGDSLYYTGISQNRAALWEYYYDDGAASNTAFDLSKHVPGFVVGKVTKIDGNAESGRVVLKAGIPNALYVHTSYWAEGKRAQNAWTRLEFPGLVAIHDFWVDDNQILLVGVSATRLWRLAMPLDTAPDAEVRLDFQTLVEAEPSGVAHVARVELPAGLHETADLVFAVQHDGDPWFTEYSGSVVNVSGTRYLDIQADLEGVSGYLGIRFERGFTFSPFYPSIGDTPTPLGRLQVRTVVVDMLKAGDVQATVTRKDRAPALVVSRTPRVLGSNALAPILGEDFQVAIPFNARGNAANLKVSTRSTAPMVVTGYTLKARYTNPHLEK
jgi:hypothetical protein